MTLDLAVIVSGGGSNLQSIIDAIEAGKLDAAIRVVLANKTDAYGLVRARKHGITAVGKPHDAFASREAFDEFLINEINDAGADTVALAGFMRLVTPPFLQAFPGRVLNIHPALLPSFPGVHGQGDAVKYGVKISGCTVHFVTQEMDSGPVIIQAAVPALPDDDANSLGRRILAMEHRIYPQALQWLAQERLRIEGRQVFLDGEPAGLAPVDGTYLVNPPLEKGF